MGNPTTATDKQALINARLAAHGDATLDDYLTDLDTGALSYNDATFELRRLTGVKITPQALRLWVREYRKQAS